MKAEKFGLKPEAIKDICETLMPGAKQAISVGNCPCCKQMIFREHFKDALSIKEFHISGMCQKCQDSVFK